MSTPEPRALTEACSMCPETLVAFTVARQNVWQG